MCSTENKTEYQTVFCYCLYSCTLFELQLHSQSASIKAFTADICTEGAEVVRRACGGHGFLLSSGIPGIITDALPLVTVEGENTVLYLQTAR